MPAADRRTFRALKNALTEIGEAVKLLPTEIPTKYPDVDWRGWAGLRDVIAHQYFDIQIDRLRPTITAEVPALLAAVKRELTDRED
ncbi:MAG: DUF86 domain-containing protein [Gemmatimonadaceae bacterium]|nr:DUF86 domain-containing protein [Acetobacteraceae bacterium]